MIHEPAVFTSRVSAIMEPQDQGDFRRWGERRYSNIREIKTNSIDPHFPI